ncbi:MAG: response regulator [Cohnella sp.]|nr:response regulator [Cohnella sp.]
MKVMLLDDEPLALRNLNLLLNKIGGVEVVGSYLHAADALGAAQANTPDIVFVDIDMPEIDGLETAERMYELNDNIAIVFVTAYDQYAVKAFELNAVDYLLKPVSQERLAMAVDRLRKQRTARTEDQDQSPNNRISVQCFVNLHLFGLDGDPLIWRTAKSRELFAYLVHKAGQPVRKETLIDLLWAEGDERKNHNQLYTAVYLIRRMLKAARLNPNIQIATMGDSYQMKVENAVIDKEEWERRLKALPPLSEGTAETHGRLVEAYTGDYLAEAGYHWAESERQRLRSLMCQHAAQLGGFWIRTGRKKEALDLYLLVQQKAPLVEEIYTELIKLYADRGDYGLAQKQYELLAGMMREQYDSEPSEEAKRIYRMAIRSKERAPNDGADGE